MCLHIHLRKRKRDPEQLKIDVKALAQELNGFSGAEIEQVVVNALFKAYAKKVEINMEVLRSAIRETYPLSETMKEQIDYVRNWAQQRARFASSCEQNENPQGSEEGRWSNLDGMKRDSDGTLY